jgi:hypothetical protein
MKPRSVPTLTLAVLMLATLMPAALAQSPKMKMTTDIPVSITVANDGREGIDAI